MYWYYKYPLLLVLLLLVFGLIYLIWTKLPQDVTEDLAQSVISSEEEITAEKETTEALPSEAPLMDRVITIEPSVPSTVSVNAEKRLDSAEDQLARDNYVAARSLAHKVLITPEVQQFDKLWKRAAAIARYLCPVLFMIQ